MSNRINPLAALMIALLAAVAAACTDDTNPTADQWVGTITTEGEVTTVVNEAGSVWGGRGRLVEELAIGVEAGADEYMFGFLNSMYANDERIVVADEQADIVRMYDRSGEFLFNVGAQGQGPGEYVMPMILTLDDRSHTFVFDMRSRRLSEFAGDGGFVTSLQIDDFGCCAWNMQPLPQGLLSVPVQETDQEARETRFGVQPFSMEGAAGETLWVPEIEFEPTTFSFDGRDINTAFSPRVYWYPTPDGGIVAGASDRYRFEVVRPDGSKLVVHHYAERTPIGSDEWEWNRAYRVAAYRQRQEGFNWDGAEMPRIHPAFTSLNASLSGEIWVGRVAGSTRIPDCSENPLEDYAGELSIQRCFKSVFVIDVFGADGLFLGEVDIPAEMSPYGLYIDGDTVVSGFNEDELGVTRIKVFRLERPGDG